MKKVLFVWGGWSGHEPEQCVSAVARAFQKEDYEMEVSNTLDSYLDAALLNAVDLIVPCWTMGEITPEQEKGLLEAIRNGAGLAGWHGGMCDSFRNSPDYQFMTGGQWVAHPGGAQCEHVVHIVKQDHPITAGLADFKMVSEKYYMHVDPSNEVLATLMFTGEEEDGVDWIGGTVMPAVWTRPFGRGKVFYSSLGHVAKDFEVPEVMEIMRRGMLWASR